MSREIAFEMAASSVRFGAGVTREVGMDLVDLGVRRALVVTDPNLTRLAPVQKVLDSLDAAGVEAVLYDRVRVEPTDLSFRDAIQFAESVTSRRYRGRRRRLGDRHGQGGEPLHDLSASGFPRLRQRADREGRCPCRARSSRSSRVPTTAGTGSETTGVSIFDLTELHAKTGIASRRLKPTLGVLDPENTRTMPPEVAASSGLDVLSHAIESFTAMPYTSRPRPASPRLASGLPGFEPDQRHLGASGAAHRRAVPRPGRR